MKANDMLSAFVPFVQFVCVLFGVIAAWKGFTLLVPAIGGVVALKGGSAETMATIAGGLALVVLAIRGKA